MKAVPADAAVYVWQGAADMRAGFERLAALVQEPLLSNSEPWQSMYVTVLID